MLKEGQLCDLAAALREEGGRGGRTEMATAFAGSFVSTGSPRPQAFHCHSTKQSKHCLGLLSDHKLSLKSKPQRRVWSTTPGKFTTRVQATYSQEGGRSVNNGSIFVGGFILGGLVVGALGCIYAPQISRAIAGADKKDLMRKLPKFIYDEEKALERTQKILASKIEQLNLAIDDVSSQLRPKYSANGASALDDDVESAI